jgi:hypothetical protein
MQDMSLNKTCEFTCAPVDDDGVETNARQRLEMVPHPFNDDGVVKTDDFAYETNTG